MLSDENLARKSKNQFSQMKSSQPLSKNASHKAMIERIGKRIAGVAQVDLPELNGNLWFSIFETQNAFAMPRGKVGLIVAWIALAIITKTK